MLTNPTTSTYRPGRRGDDTRPGMDGRRGDQARELRAILASRRRDIRSWARDARMIGADGNSGVLIALTTRTVDGVLQGEPVFGPTESRTPRGLAADSLRREYVFDCAEDHGSRALDRLYHRAAGVHFLAQARYLGIPIT